MLAGAALFNLGQGVLRPTLPLYLREVFSANSAGGWLYQGVGVASPFVFEAACMLVSAIVVGWWAARGDRPAPAQQGTRDRRLLAVVLRTPGVLLMSVTNAALIAIQTGVLVAALPTALIGDQVPSPQQGVAIGWLRTMTDSGQILGPLVMGAVADAVDLSTPFFLGAALLMVAAWQCGRRARVLSAST